MDKANEDNHFKAVCNGICVAYGLDAAVLVTVKSAKENAEIALNGDGPNDKAVAKIKHIIAHAIAESIMAYKKQKAASEKANKREAINAD